MKKSNKDDLSSDIKNKQNDPPKSERIKDIKKFIEQQIEKDNKEKADKEKDERIEKLALKAENDKEFEKLLTKDSINKFYKLENKKRFTLLTKLTPMFNPAISIILLLILLPGWAMIFSLPFMPMEIGWKIFATIFCFVILGTITTVTIIFYFVPKFQEIKDRWKEKVVLKKGDIALGYLIEYRCEKFFTAKRLKGGGNFCRLKGEIRFVDFNGNIETVSLNNIKLKTDPNLVVGMRIPVCFDKGVALALLSCTLKNEEGITAYKNILEQNNKLLLSAPPKETEYFDELKQIYENKEFYKASKIKDIAPLGTLYSIAYALAFFSFFGAFLFSLITAVSVIIHNPTDFDQILMACLMIVFFCGTTLFVCIFSTVQILKPIFRNLANKKAMAKSLVSYAYVISFDEFVFTRANKSSSRRTMIRQIVNYRFINNYGKLIDGISYGVYDYGFEYKVCVGLKIPVMFNNNNNKLIESFEGENKYSELNDSNNKLDDTAKKLVEYLPKERPNFSKESKIKSEIILKGYFIFAAILAAFSLPLVILTVLAIIGSLSLFAFLILLLLNSAEILIVTFSVYLFVSGLKKYFKAKQIIKTGELAYAFLYKNPDSQGNAFIKKYEYVFKDYKGNIRKGCTSQYFYQATKVNFDPIYKMRHKNGKPKLITPFKMEDLKFEGEQVQLVTVAYTEDNSIIVFN